MKNKINCCRDIDLSKINLKCCDNEIVSIQEAGPIQSHFFDAALYLMQSRVREGLIKTMGVKFFFGTSYNGYKQCNISIQKPSDCF